MSPDPSRWLTALRHSQDRLAQSVRGLDAAAIEAPSYASEWSVAQVLSHLGSQAEIFGLILEAGLTGGDAPGQDAFPVIWDAWNGRSPESQVADSLLANEALVGRLEGLDAAQMESFRLAAFGMDLDMTMFLRLRVAEHAVHSWDVAVTFDPSATVGHDAVELLVDVVRGHGGPGGKAHRRVVHVAGDDDRPRPHVRARDRRGRLWSRGPSARSPACCGSPPRSSSASSTAASTPTMRRRCSSTRRA